VIVSTGGASEPSDTLLPGKAGSAVAVRRTLAFTICRITIPTQTTRPRQIRDASTVIRFQPAHQSMINRRFGDRGSGPQPAEILIFTMMTVITAATSEAARAKLEDYRSYASEEGALVLMSGWTGVDFSKYGLDDPIRNSRQDAQTSALEAFTIADPARVWTVREIAKHAALGGRGPVVVGSPEEVAEELIAWVEETDVDGFNLAYPVTPETFVDFVDLVVPELQRRGRYKLDYAPGTLREKLYGPGRARLGEDHPASRFRPVNRKMSVEREGSIASMISRDAWDVIILGSGVAGLAAALAAHELGLRPLALEKASRLGGGTVSSYGLIWVGQNHQAQAAGYSDARDEVIAYLRFLGGGSCDDARMSAFVEHSPEALRFFEQCGVRFHVVRGLTDHYYGKSPGSHAVGRPPAPMEAATGVSFAAHHGLALCVEP
jgi:hypothetical protein